MDVADIGNFWMLALRKRDTI